MAASPACTRGAFELLGFARGIVARTLSESSRPLVNARRIRFIAHSRHRSGAVPTGTGVAGQSAGFFFRPSCAKPHSFWCSDRLYFFNRATVLGAKALRPTSIASS